jgi:hypothetical protein
MPVGWRVSWLGAPIRESSGPRSVWRAWPVSNTSWKRPRTGGRLRSGTTVNAALTAFLQLVPKITSAHYTAETPVRAGQAQRLPMENRQVPRGEPGDVVPVLDRGQRSLDLDLPLPVVRGIPTTHPLEVLSATSEPADSVVAVVVRRAVRQRGGVDDLQRDTLVPDSRAGRHPESLHTVG